MKLNITIIVAIIYFFLNIVGLPFGLTYTALLAPVFYVWILLKRKKEVLLPFICCLLPFICVHIFLIKADLKEYLVSLANILAVYIFCQAFYTWLKIGEHKERVFTLLLGINIVLCLVAVVFYFTPADHIFWIRQNLTANVEDFRRLKMFTYEASYYAMLFVPLFAYFLMQYVLRQNTIQSRWLLLLLFIPMVLSFSVGVIMCLVAAGILTFIIQFRRLHAKRRIVNGFITGGFIALVAALLIVVFFPGNPVLLRIQNIIAGNDTSAMGRTAEAFDLARAILDTKNNYWGIGPGQLNLEGADIIRGYYLYYFNTPVAIPNAAAETLVLFGWIGLLLRIIVQLFFFVITKVWTNYYRLLLFFFIFLFQFAGSYITNVAEYVIWILAFTNAFPAFDTVKKPEALSNRPFAFFETKPEASVLHKQ